MMGSWHQLQWVSSMIKKLFVLVICLLFYADSLLSITNVRAVQDFLDSSDILKISFTKDEKKELKRKYRVKQLKNSYKIYVNGENYGILVAQEGWGGPINLFVIFDKNYNVENIIFLEHSETRMKKVKRKSYLKQFYNRNFADFFIKRIRIDSVSAATISSKAVRNAVKKSLVILKFLSDNKSNN